VSTLSKTFVEHFYCAIAGGKCEAQLDFINFHRLVLVVEFLADAFGAYGLT
jgi:hypothetical protein